MYWELIESKSCFFAFYFDKNIVKDTLLADWILEELVVLTHSVLLGVDFLDVITGFYSFFAS